MWVALVLAIGALAAEGETSEITTVKTVQDSNALIEVTGWVERETITSGERKGWNSQWAHLRIVGKGDGIQWEGPFDRDVDVDEIVMTGEHEFTTITNLCNTQGSRIVRWQVSMDMTPKEMKEEYVYSPCLAPNRRWVFYTYWYPRLSPVEERHTSTWMLDITQPEFKPVLLYPPANVTGIAPDGRTHDALVSGGNLLWSADCGKLYYFDRLSLDQNWKEAVVSLVEIQIGDDMTIEKTTAFPVKVEDFAKPGADLTKLAFYPRELHWADDGVIGGRLSQEAGWKSQNLRTSIEGAYLNPDGAK